MATGPTFQLFAKSPVAGTVKTRLFGALTPAAAATLQTRMIEHAARAIVTACAAIPQARGELWCTPDTASRVLGDIAGRHGLALRQQTAGDLGTRMRVALETAMPGRVLLLGSDCPVLDAPLLIDACRTLLRHEAVFVPVEDGGYALVGCRDRVPDCFAGIAWSTRSVMRQTRAHLIAAAIEWQELPVAWDVDTPADLERLRGDVRFSHLVAGLIRHGAAELQQQPGQPL